MFVAFHFLMDAHPLEPYNGNFFLPPTRFYDVNLLRIDYELKLRTKLVNYTSRNSSLHLGDKNEKDYIHYLFRAIHDRMSGPT
jgi:hypothetical protein